MGISGKSIGSSLEYKKICFGLGIPISHDFSRLVKIFTELASTEQGKSEGFDSCDRPNNLTQMGFKSSILQPMWPWNLMDDLKNRAPFLYYIKLCASFQNHRWIQTGFTVRKRSIPVKIGDFLSRVILKFDGRSWKNRAPPLWCFKLGAPSHSHQRISTWVTVRKHPILVNKNYEFLVMCPWNLTDDLEKQ